MFVEGLKNQLSVAITKIWKLKNRKVKNIDYHLYYLFMLYVCCSFIAPTFEIATAPPNVYVLFKAITTIAFHVTCAAFVQATLQKSSDLNGF